MSLSRTTSPLALSLRRKMRSALLSRIPRIIEQNKDMTQVKLAEIRIKIYKPCRNLAISYIQKNPTYQGTIQRLYTYTLRKSYVPSRKHLPLP